MKNFEVQHTIRLYDPNLIAEIGRTLEAHHKEYRNKNEFLTEILRLGIKQKNLSATNSSDVPLDAKESLTKEVEDIQAITREMSKYLTTQFKKLYIHLTVAERLLSAIYNMELGDLSGAPPLAEKVEDGFFDDLPARFEKIILTLENRYGLR